MIAMNSGRAIALSDIMGSDPPRERGNRSRENGAGFDDDALIMQILERDSQTHLQLLILRHQQHVHDLVCSVLGPTNQAEVEETCQLTFIKVIEKLSTFRRESSFSTWAYRVAYNTALDSLRSIHRRQRGAAGAEVLEKLSSQQHEPDRVAVDDEEQQRVRQVVAELPDLYRTLIHLHYWRGLSIKQIADTLESRPGTIKSYLHRARARMAKKLGDSS